MEAQAAFARLRLYLLQATIVLPRFRQGYRIQSARTHINHSVKQKSITCG
jgi:hypothetical protein